MVCIILLKLKESVSYLVLAETTRQCTNPDVKKLRIYDVIMSELYHITYNILQREKFWSYTLVVHIGRTQKSEQSEICLSLQFLYGVKKMLRWYVGGNH